MKTEIGGARGWTKRDKTSGEFMAAKRPGKKNTQPPERWELSFYRDLLLQQNVVVRQKRNIDRVHRIHGVNLDPIPA